MKPISRIVIVGVAILAGFTRPASAISLSGGDIPVPAKLVNGVYQPVWDGSYPELLAADALATCWTTQRATPAFIGSEPDFFIATLLSRMTTASCRTTCSNPAYTQPEDISICAYLDSRKDAACNMDPASRQAKALDVSKLRNSLVTQDYQLPTAATLGLSGGGAAMAMLSAQQELSYAELSLCMAEQLSQKLETVQVAFASGDDLARLQQIVRERAVTAVYEYGVIGKTLASTAAPPTILNTVGVAGGDWYLAPLALWKNTTMSSSTATRLGDDFTEAVKLLVEVTQSSIDLKMRSPDAQSSFGTPRWNGTLRGMAGSRQDILSQILYDGISENGWTTSRTAVTTDTSAPQVGVLLGLARRANALRVHLSNSTTPIDSPANASTLLLAVENFVRNEDCVRNGTPPASCVLANGTTAPTSYVLWQRYAITLGHARTLSDALAEAVFGPPTPASRQSGWWAHNSDPFARGTTAPIGPAERLTMHLFGNLQFTGNLAFSYPAGDVILPSNVSMIPPDAIDIQALRPVANLPVRSVNPLGRAQDQIGYFRASIVDNSTGTNVFVRRLGANTVLALAREALLELAQAATIPRNIYLEAVPSLTLIEKVIGLRQVTIRETLPTQTSTACSGCFAVSYTGSASLPYTADVLTKTADPYTAIATAPGIPLAATLARDANTRTVFGATQASAIGTLPFASPTATTLASGYLRRTATGTWTYPSQVTVLVRSITGGTTYQHVFTGGFHDNSFISSWAAYPGPRGTVVTFGGRFGRQVSNAWTFDSERWSTPKLDGFGLPRDWAPAADASLFGNAPGVTVERHFLARAAAAAEESAIALQQTFDLLQQQATDDAAIVSSDMRSERLTNLEYQSLCGTLMPTCTPSYQLTLPVVPLCSGPASPDCEAFRTHLSKVVGNPIGGPATKGVPLAKAVKDEIQAGNPAPTFESFKGGVLQGLFVSQWNGWQAVNAAMVGAVGTSQSAIAQVAAANADVTAANADYTQVAAEVDTAYAQVGAQNTMIAAQRVQYNAQKATYDVQLAAAQTTVDRDCSQDTFTAAVHAGYSFSKGDCIYPVVTVDANGGYDITVYDQDNTSWSPSAVIAAVARCHASQTALAVAATTAQVQKDAINILLVALQSQASALNVQANALPTRLAASQKHKESAIARLAAAKQGVATQQAGALQTVQAALGQLMGSTAAVDAAYAQADIATAKTGVDQYQLNYDIRTRFGLRARFHSYDLWRARALTENARRLALAARRAIESRYVVDLSAMSASEPFVDAPALWADQIYASDLKPFSIGLTPGPTSGTGLYTSAVKDYVGNLALFLDGFPVQRPSASVISDAEVIQIPAPAAQVVTSVYGASVNYIEPGSTGWAFYCPNTSTWIADPDVGRFVTTTPTWLLSTACGGSAPTLARYSFSLDPWGRPQGSITAPPFTSRYNVRMGPVAVNLVGSGIRACQNAPDPAACYAEPFIRYDLKHIGPAWVTSYEGDWRSLDIPRAVIEAGKALASEEWLDPVANGFSRADVMSVARQEFIGRPIGGAYELTIRLTPDVRVERIGRIQLLAQTGYWVRQQ